MPLRSDVTSALMLMTRLPVTTALRAPPTPRAADAAWAWPLAGLLVAMIAVGAGWGVWFLGATPAVAAALTLTLQIVLTGALHEDGLADMADGIWGGSTPERRLEIMRDSRIGTYGMVALVLTLTIRWSLIATAMVQMQVLPVLIAAVVSRASMAVAMRWLPPARTDGLSHGMGRPPAIVAQVCLGLAVLALIPVEGHGLVAGLLVLGVLAGIGTLARSRIGGQTGDVLGAIQQLSEIAVLAALTSV